MCENILVRKIIESKLGTLLLLLVVVVEEVVYIYIHTTKCHIISFEHNKGEILLNCLNI